MNLTDEKDVLEFCEQKRAEMAAAFARDGEFNVNGFSFCAWLFATREPPTRDERGWKQGAKSESVYILPVELPAFMGVIVPPEKHTEAFRYCIDRMMAQCEAIGWVLAAEQWMVSYSPIEGESAEQARARLPKNIADYSGRKEGLLLTLEHRATGARQWIAEIKRNPTRLESWTAQRFARLEGTLIGALPTETDPGKLS